ncbi:MAG: hypothetical protein PWQ51_1279 [Methanolobus sp.]|jgi:hypothetical protein|nr:hypothetical protein [Methanolobus sp.]
MKIKAFMLLLLVCAISISGCADSDNGDDTVPSNSEEEPMADDSMDESMNEEMEDTMDDEMGQMSEPDAEGIFSEITDADNYKEWSIWPGTGAMEDGTGVHGEYVTVYVSDNAVSAAEVGGEMLPYETMVVKEGFNEDEELTGIYLMYKIEDYDPENNDWFWAAYSPDGNVNAEGRVAGCINCHSDEQDADYVFFNA